MCKVPSTGLEQSKHSFKGSGNKDGDKDDDANNDNDKNSDAKTDHNETVMR